METLLALAHPFVVLLMGVLLATVWQFDRKQRYFMSFALALVMYASGMLMQITLLPSVLHVNVTLSGLLYLAAAVLFCRGLTQLDNAAAPWWPLLLILLLSSFGRAYFTYVEWNGAARIYVLHSTVTILLAITSWQVRSLRRGSWYERLLFWLVVGLTASFVPRTLLTIPANKERYGYDHSLFWVSIQLTFYVFIVMFALTLLLVAATRALAVIRQASLLDPLTAINNRSGFHSHVGAQMQDCRRYGLIALDIDFFKRVNDNHGHAAGDKVLVALARLLRNNLRSQDIIARYGGEEFLIFVPEATRESVRAIADKLRTAIEKLDLSDIAPDLACTASFGAAVFDATTPLEQAYADVDALLYQAKAEGRNRVALGKGVRFEFKARA